MIRARILIVEDESLVAADLEDRLTRLGHTVTGIADNGTDALRSARESQPDLALMDIKLIGPMDGIQVAGELRKELQVPVVFLTSHADRSTLDRACATEPFGYVVKPFEEHDLMAAIETASHRHRAEQRLHKMERWLAITLQSIGDGVISSDLDGRITFLNAKAEEITGWSLANASGRSLDEVFQLYQAGTDCRLQDPAAMALREDRVVTLADNAVLRPARGREIPVEDSAAPIREASGSPSGVVLVFRDVTRRREAEAERRRIEQKLQETQRLESLGVLASGLAHDFNNLLMTILCNAELGRASLPGESPAAPHLQQIETASLRAAELCRQMMAYAGKARRETSSLEPNELVKETVQLLRASICKKTALQLDLDSTVPRLECDPSQIRQVLMNLIINASEALEGNHGIVRIRTALFRADRASLAACIQGRDLPEGDYILVEVSDSGCGIEPDALARMFDPFFTTKALGRGLGLAAVYGIVHAHRGALRVESEPGRGSVFGLLLPVSSSQPGAAKPPTPQAKAEWQGRVLVVDDEAPTREVVAQAVRRLGFEVVTADNGVDALEKLRTAASPFRVVFMDLAMPHMDGLETTRQIRRIDSDLPVILMTGFAEDAVSPAMQELKLAAFFQKPFTMTDLRSKLAAVLGKPAGTGTR